MDSDGVCALIPVCSSIMVEGSQAQLSFGVGDSFSTFDELETKVKAYERAHFVHFGSEIHELSKRQKAP